MNILENTVAGLRMNGVRKKAFLHEAAEAALRQAALWDEVKDRLRYPPSACPAANSSGSASPVRWRWSPRSSSSMSRAQPSRPAGLGAEIEQLIVQLSEHITVAMVTHNLFQARRISDRTAVFLLGDDGSGQLVESGPTADVFEDPKDPRTKEYVTGHMG